MGAHPSGDGAAWDSLEAIDVDQPHGKDYVTWNHMAIAIRKRIGQEHSEFADTTAGAIHKPGGAAVLGMEITDDCTATTVADGTYRARGLVWSYSDTSNWGVLFCNSSNAGVSTCGDFTVLKMHPDLQWGGGDVTWAGAHEFDASVDISGPLDVWGAAEFSAVDISGTLDVTGGLQCGSNVTIQQALVCDSDVGIGGDFSVDGTADFAGDVAFEADISIDGTTALEDVVITGDVSASQVPSVWGSFCGNAGATLLDSYNVASVARNATGDYSVTFSNALADTNYAVIATVSDSSAGSGNRMYTAQCISKLTTGVRIKTGDSYNGEFDVSRVGFMILGG